MRELKFRAWDTAFKRYAGYEFETLLVNPNGFGSYGDRYIWEQYTGFKDKNGKEIYEGDIIKVGIMNCEVKFCEMKDSDCTYFYQGWGYGDSCENMSLYEEHYCTEVIGNIHENPELLEHKG